MTSYGRNQVAASLWSSFNEQAKAAGAEECHGYGEAPCAFYSVEVEDDYTTFLKDSNGKTICHAKEKCTVYMPTHLAVISIAAPGAMYAEKRELLGSIQDVKEFRDRLKAWLG